MGTIASLVVVAAAAVGVAAAVAVELSSRAVFIYPTMDSTEWSINDQSILPRSAMKLVMTSCMMARPGKRLAVLSEVYYATVVHLQIGMDTSFMRSGISGFFWRLDLVPSPVIGCETHRPEQFLPPLLHPCYQCDQGSWFFVLFYPREVSFSSCPCRASLSLDPSALFLNLASVLGSFASSFYGLNHPGF